MSWRSDFGGPTGPFPGYGQHHGYAWGASPVPRRRRRLGWWSITAVAVAAAAVGGFGLGYGSGNSPFPLAPGTHSSTPSASSRPLDASGVADKVDPGLVDITTRFTGQSGGGAGTGMVLSPNGTVLTNNHVINGAGTISVRDVGNGRTYQADVVGYDRSDDVAVLQLRDASGLPTVSIGDSSGAGVGDRVYALGNAGGKGGTPAEAAGAVTAVNRAITVSDDSSGTLQRLSGLIQVSANLQPGDSGGALVNTSGQVIGMNTAAPARPQAAESRSTQGAGFVIPINKAMAIGKQIENRQAGPNIHIGPTALLGVRVAQAPQGSQSGQDGSGGLPGGFGDQDGSGGTSGSGAAIVGVMPGSPAETAGLLPGDVITSVDNQSVDSASTLTNLMQAHHPNDRVSLQWVDQSGEQHSGTVQLVAGPPN